MIPVNKGKTIKIMNEIVFYSKSEKERLNIRKEKYWIWCHFPINDSHARQMEKTFHLYVALILR